MKSPETNVRGQDAINNCTRGEKLITQKNKKMLYNAKSTVMRVRTLLCFLSGKNIDGYAKKLWLNASVEQILEVFKNCKTERSKSCLHLICTYDLNVKKLWVIARIVVKMVFIAKKWKKCIIAMTVGALCKKKEQKIGEILTSIWGLNNFSRAGQSYAKKIRPFIWIDLGRLSVTMLQNCTVMVAERKI